MQSYLERYLEGECQGVWTELVGLGPAIRSEPLYSDAVAVGREMMTRAKHNVNLLIERLKTLGYRFIDPDRVLQPPEMQRPPDFAALEERYGPFPLAIRMWAEIVGSVDFIGAHPKLSQHPDCNWGNSAQLRSYGDPMVVSITAGRGGELTSFYLDRVDDEEEGAQMEAEMPPAYRLVVGLSAINKAGESGGGSVDMLVPNSAFDAPLIDSDGYWMGTFFVPYVRACFKWGGFPGLKGDGLPRGQWDPEYSREEIDFLTKDLISL